MEKSETPRSHQIANFFMQEIKELLVHDIEHNPLYKGVSLEAFERANIACEERESFYNILFSASPLDVDKYPKTLSYFWCVKIIVNAHQLVIQDLHRNVIAESNGCDIVDCYFKLRSVILDEISNLRIKTKNANNFKSWLSENNEKILRAQKP